MTRDEIRAWLLGDDADSIVRQAFMDVWQAGGGTVHAARVVRERLAAALPSSDGGEREALRQLRSALARHEAITERVIGGERVERAEVIAADAALIATARAVAAVAASSSPPAGGEGRDAAAREVVMIARCPEHGLHGERTECFVCGGPVEQVPMVPASKDSAPRRWAIDPASAADGLRGAVSELEAECDRLRVLLQDLLDASAPYIQRAAPHEQLFSGEDLRNFERLTAARRRAIEAVPVEPSPSAAEALTGEEAA